MSINTKHPNCQPLPVGLAPAKISGKPLDVPRAIIALLYHPVHAYPDLLAHRHEPQRQQRDHEQLLDHSAGVYRLLKNYRVHLHRLLLVRGLHQLHCTYVVMNVIISLALALPAAYAFSRYRFLGDKHVFFWFLTNRMAPGAVFALPFFQLYSAFGLIDTHIAVALAHCLFNIPLAIWILGRLHVWRAEGN